MYQAYQILLRKMGPSGWWPAKTGFEVIVGAILTQNTSWKNVEKALTEVKSAGILTPRKMAATPTDSLARLIHSSGYYNQKAHKLKVFLKWFSGYNYSLANLRRRFLNRSDELRDELLELHGIGPETADSILCYALELPYFVVDNYTYRWLERYRPELASRNYGVVQHLVETTFKKKAPINDLTRHFNEFHALLVRLCNTICLKRNPGCEKCPLTSRCSYPGAEYPGSNRGCQQ